MKVVARALTQKVLEADLQRMGIRAGDILIVHSSMKSIGWVQGGPRAVIRALQRALTRRGTLLMPTFSYCFERLYEPTKPYDPRNSPSQTGLLTETFRQCAGVRRSGHPTHSVAAWGRLAEEMTAGHERIAGLGADSPFHRAAQRGAKVLMIGCNFTSLSLLHVAEEIAQAPYLQIFNWWHVNWKPTALMLDQDGRTVQVGYPSVPGCSRSFGRIEKLAAKRGLLREVRFGNARSLLFDAQQVLDLAVAQLRRKPDCLLCEPITCRACDERRVVFDMTSSPGAKAVGEILIDLASKTGIRLAGTPAERKAADLIAEQMQSIGLSDVRVHEFPIPRWKPGYSVVEVLVDNSWVRIPSAPAAHVPSTNGRTIRGRTGCLEVFHELPKVRSSGAEIVLLWDGYGQSAAEFRRLMSSGFKALIMVDNRLENEDIVAAGIPAKWIKYCRTPMVSVPQPFAAKLFGRGPTECRIRSTGRTIPGTSTVVSGEIPGRRPEAILVCGHHDSTANSLAADDNLVGVVCMLRVAKLLIGHGTPRYTIRFCSFGSEEMLSEGARWYALESGLGRNIRFVVNTDSGGARVGTTCVRVTGHSALAAWLQRQARRASLQVRMIEEVCPFSDQFPFNVLGAPSLWFYRKTTAAGRHYHHTVRDSLAEISFEQVARLAKFEADLVRKIAFYDKPPFPLYLPYRLEGQVAALKQDWLDG